MKTIEKTVCPTLREDKTTYKDFAFVQAECGSLARQLKEMAHV